MAPRRTRAGFCSPLRLMSALLALAAVAALLALLHPGSGTNSESARSEALSSAAADDGVPVRSTQRLRARGDAEAREQRERLRSEANAHPDSRSQSSHKKRSKSKYALQTIPPKPAQVSTQHGSVSTGTVLLIICADRPEYLARSLAKVVEYHPHENFAIVVSEDGHSQGVREVVERATKAFAENEKNAGIPFLHIQHPEYNAPAENGYFKLSRHFKYALEQVFDKYASIGLLEQVQRVVILEEDLEIANDFFEYFTAVSSMVDSDTSLLCASAWNDNGQEGKVRDETALVRSDFFPGLGWMVPKRIWNELGPRWPAAYWDDWLREPAQRQNRHTIRPEVCRTLHFGVHGVSNSQFNEYLQSIRLSTANVRFTQIDLSYLVLGTWDAAYLERVRTSVLATRQSFDTQVKQGATELRIAYGSFGDYEQLARWAGVMADVKAGVPRGAYKGIVSTYLGGARLHLCPESFT